MIIEPRGLWEYSAYQADNRFILEIKPIQEDPNKLTQGTRKGYKGEKLSLNFQNVEVRAVLQVIAGEDPKKVRELVRESAAFEAELQQLEDELAQASAESKADLQQLALGQLDQLVVLRGPDARPKLLQLINCG